MEKVEKKRDLAKTLRWRSLATTGTFLIAWIITGKIDWAAGISGIEVLTKMFFFTGLNVFGIKTLNSECETFDWKRPCRVINFINNEMFFNFSGYESGQ